MLQLTLYTRQGCHLCEDMLLQLRQLQQDWSFGLAVCDVDSNPQWHNLYHERVPVLFSGEQLLSQYFLDLKQLEIHLNEHSAQL